MTYDLTRTLSRFPVDDPETLAAQAGSEMRSALTGLEEKAREADRRVKDIESRIDAEIAPHLEKIARWQKFADEILAAIEVEEEAVSAIASRHSDRLSEAYTAYGEAEEAVRVERHRLRLMSELGDECVKIANGE